MVVFGSFLDMVGWQQRNKLMVAAAIPDRLRRHEPVRMPHADGADLAKLSSALHAAMKREETHCSLVGPNGEVFALPETIFHILVRVVEVMERGDALTLIPVHKELTTQQAANLLNVSRQYLVRLLDEGRLPYMKTGKHRRLRIDDVMAYKQTRDADRQASLDELARLSEEFVGYDELKK
jgi:excisionase family DNA binding protein